MLGSKRNKLCSTTEAERCLPHTHIETEALNIKQHHLWVTSFGRARILCDLKTRRHRIGCAEKKAKRRRSVACTVAYGRHQANQFDILITLFQINTLWSHALANCDFQHKKRIFLRHRSTRRFLFSGKNETKLKKFFDFSHPSRSKNFSPLKLHCRKWLGMMFPWSSQFSRLVACKS